MTILTSFEVIAQPVAPGIENVPFVQQGTFVQITNMGPTTVLGLEYDPSSPAFVSTTSDGALTLFANYIDGTGAITQYGQFLVGTPGFGGIIIQTGQTYIFGVQYIFTPPSDLSAIAMAGGTPQSTATARGPLQITSTTPGSNLLCTATIRQVFNNYDPDTGELLDVDEAAYALPIVGGPLVSF